MKNFKSLLIIIPLVAFMLLGVGYASWNKTYTMGNTVRTGCFDVTMSDDNVDKIKSSLNTTALGTVTNNGHSVSIAISGLYPGAYTGVNKIIKNNSSIPISINSANFVSLHDSDQSIDANRILLHTVSIATLDDIATGNQAETLISDTSAGLDSRLNFTPVILAPAQSCVFQYRVSWPKNVDSTDNIYRNQTIPLSFTYTLGYTQ